MPKEKMLTTKSEDKWGNRGGEKVISAIWCALSHDNFSE